jgi:hypothetical protein
MLDWRVALPQTIAVIASGSDAIQTKAAAASPGLLRRCAPSQ